MTLLIAIALSVALFARVDAVQFNDINIAVVTDAHSWLSQHAHPDHTPSLDADYGTIASSVLHLKSLASLSNKDVFFVNNGDHTEGSGLSDASIYTEGIHGYDLFPLIGMMPFDALTIGNHDLYDDSTVGWMKGGSGFIDGWGGRYLTSNTVNSTTGEEVGERYTIMKGENSGVSILTFGFLYHQTDACSSVIVKDPADVVEEDWFVSAVLDNADDVDAIVVLSHMDKDDDNVGIILDGIRGLKELNDKLESIPVQFITGHTHYRGWNKKDDYSSSFEAGHYLDTLGWISFNITDEPIWFDFEYVDANREVLYDFTSTTPETFDTDLGLSITVAITETVNSLNLAEVLGCPDQGYSYQAGIGTDDSLYDLYMNTIIPTSVLDESTGTGNVPYHLSSTGTLRYDVYPGNFYYDDVFAIAPFANTFLYTPNLTGELVSRVFESLLDLSTTVFEDTHTIPLASTNFPSTLPRYVGGPSFVDPSDTYDLFFNDYDQPYVVRAIAMEMGVDEGDVEVVGWRDDMESDNYVDTTICWAKKVGELWPCDAAAVKQ